MLKVKKLSVSYNGHQALDGVSIDIKKGEFVALIGANGAGKTTTLRSIAGMVKAAYGEVLFENINITNISPHKVVEMGISLVPQERRLFPEMTVDENLRLGAFTLRARKNTKRSIEHIFRMLPILKERAGQVAKTLSGGEQQILAIARALMAMPTLLMLDEPLLGISPIMITNIFKILKEIREEGTTIFLVEQNLHMSLKFCDRAYILENGKIVMEGSSNELLNNEYVKKIYLGIK